MRALILVDLQNDFCAGGALAVPDGDSVMPIANQLVPRFPLVVATQDWHPRSHLSFASNHPGKKLYDQVELDGLPQVLWPDHCVQNSKGAEFHPQLDMQGVHKVFHKGTDERIDSYSGFFDNGHKKATGLGDYLKAQGVHELYVLGLATDYCVRFTALDAVQLGFTVHLVQDACRGVGLGATDIADAVQQMRAAGVRITDSKSLSL